MVQDQDEDCEVTFRCMGCHMRLIVGARSDRSVPPAAEAAANARNWLDGFDRRLSRFKADSELSQFNADGRSSVPASALLRTAIRAGLWAAERSSGLVDPTLLDEVEAAGYRQSLADAHPAALRDALRSAPARRPARARPDMPWQQFRVDDDNELVQRPPGLRFDPGGIGKGLAADAVAYQLRGYERYAVDCAGDLRVGGPLAAEHPFRIEIDHPLTGDVAHVLTVAEGGVATSALSSRVWRDSSGGYAHHLIDPSTGRPAWTGLVSATALAASTLEAETLAKTALLAGADGARECLADAGGVLVHDDGEVEPAGLRLRLR
jgi:thiamine biosynthesis lipoprotein